MSRKKTVYVDQEQDGDEEYLSSFLVNWDGDENQFDSHEDALGYAQDLAEENNLKVVDTGDYGV